MYNGIGLATVRGSATSGFVTRNKASAPRHYRTPSSQSTTQQRRVPNRELQHHAAKRQVENQLLILREELEEQGKLTAAEIDERIAQERESQQGEEGQDTNDTQHLLVARPPTAPGRRRATTNAHWEDRKKVHANASLAHALGISTQGRVEGAAFDQELQREQRQERLQVLAREEKRMEKERKAREKEQKAIEKEERRKKRRRSPSSSSSSGSSTSGSSSSSSSSSSRRPKSRSRRPPRKVQVLRSDEDDISEMSEARKKRKEKKLKEAKDEAPKESQPRKRRWDEPPAQEVPVNPNDPPKEDLQTLPALPKESDATQGTEQPAKEDVDTPAAKPKVTGSKRKDIQGGKSRTSQDHAKKRSARSKRRSSSSSSGSSSSSSSSGSSTSGSQSRRRRHSRSSSSSSSSSRR